MTTIIGPYEVLAVQGSGGFSQVLRARHTQTSTLVALKRLSLEPTISALAYREFAILRSLSHPHIVSVFNQVVTDDQIYFVFEYCMSDMGSWIWRARDKGGVSKGLVQSWGWQLMHGLGYLHGMDIIHQDIKPHNILITNHLVLKIADLGLAKLGGVSINPYTMDVVATVPYRAPEVLLGSFSFGPEVDIWAAGCTLAELLIGHCIFNKRTPETVLEEIMITMGHPPHNDLLEVAVQHPETRGHMYELLKYRLFKRKAWDEIIPRLNMDRKWDRVFTNLLDQLLDFNGNKRPSAAMAGFHPFFSEYAEP